MPKLLLRISIFAAIASLAFGCYALQWFIHSIGQEKSYVFLTLTGQTNDPDYYVYSAWHNECQRHYALAIEDWNKWMARNPGNKDIEKRALWHREYCYRELQKSGQLQ